MEGTKKPPLNAADLARLRKFCGLFSSEHAGERANAAAMADRFLRDRQLRWPDVIQVPTLPPPAWKPPPGNGAWGRLRATARHCLFVAVGNRVTPVPPHRSRRATFPHRALAEGQTRSKVGAWAAHACFDP
jgi:hypothetical protein